MLKRTVFFLCLTSSACAELPPVTGSGGNVSSAPASAITQPTASASSLFEMTKRIEQLQTEVQQLTGKVEEQAYHIEELKKQQKTMFTDFDDRIQSVENKSSASAAEPAVTEKPVETPIEPTPATVSSAAPGAVAATASSGETPPAQPAADSPPVSEAEKQEYQQAYDALRNGKTDDSISKFNAFIANHPDSPYASNSKYWLGEAFRVNMNNAEAKKAFGDVVQIYPKSAKVPDALFKLGMIEAEENNPAKAKEYYTRITTEFPASRAAGLAQKKLQSLEGVTP